MKTKIESKLILAFDYVLILVVDMSTRDYKKELDGHLEYIYRVRDLEIEFSREQCSSCQREIKEISCSEG